MFAGVSAVNDQTSIPIDKWSEHITKMRADSNLGFAQQFEVTRWTSV